MRQVDALPDDLRQRARNLGIHVVGGVYGKRALVFLGEFVRGVERENGQSTCKGGIKISGQGIDYFVAIASE
jgi:hypothetical protein